MRLLLDTHVFVWWVDDDKRLRPEAKQAISDPANQVEVSLISIWEIAIKHGLNKMSAAPERMLAEIDDHSFSRLDLDASHILKSGALSLHHRDPFDRMLIAQATVEGLTVVTHDDWFRPYGIPILWT